MNISTIDLIVFIAYCLLILLVGLFVSKERHKMPVTIFWPAEAWLGGQ